MGKKMDYGILVSTLLLLGFGIVFVYSSSFAVAQYKFGGSDFFLGRQVIRAILGLVCFIVFINIDYHVLIRFSNAAYVIAVALLIYVLLLPESQAVNGAKRWINLGFLKFQVSEFARIVMILMLVKHLERLGSRISEWKILVIELLKIAPICILVGIEPDFSTAMLLGIIAFTVLFVAGAKFWHLTGIVFSVIPLIVMAITSTHYRRQRFLGFLKLAEHKEDIGYQAHQALIGLGNGGIFGVGLGQGEQKLFYLPEPHTDFVFSILGEEVGLAGLVVVFAIFAFLIYRSMRIALKAPDRAGQITAFGLTFVLALYVIIHASVNTGLVPTTGVPLPFLSYGGMSLIFTMSGMGILLNISSQIRKDVQPSLKPGKIRAKRRRY